MSKSIKFKNDTYIDSSSIIHKGAYEKVLLSRFFNGMEITNESQLLNANTQCFFTIISSIVIKDVTIPVYTKGLIMPIQSKDACLLAVDSNGFLYVGFRNGNSSWLNMRKI